MQFKEAYEEMKNGAKIKLPSWGGYWAWEDDNIMMHTKEGNVINLLDTERPEYTFDNIASDEWVIADEKNTPILGGIALFNFGEAIKYMKRGFSVKRQGWNGKNQHIELASNISYTTPGGAIVNCEHSAIGNKAIAFVGTSGVQMGWLASQADMLADDWRFCDKQ